MPKAITADNIADLVSTTLDHLGPPRFYQVAQELPRYVFVDDMLKSKVQFDTGKGIERDAMFTHEERAHHTSMFATNNVAIPDVMSKIRIPWKHTTTNYAFEAREFSMNTGAARLADLVKTRRVDALLGFVSLMERTAWNSNATSDDQNTAPYGVNTYVVRGTTEGFTGANPTGFTSGVGGVNSTNVANWRNYYAEYGSVSKDDLLAKMRRCMRNIDFRAPMNGQTEDQTHGNSNKMYTNETVINALELLAEAQNDNLGMDLAPYTDRAMINRVPIRWVPYLDDVADNPIYLLNTGYFFPVVLSGWYLREKVIKDNPMQHNSVAVHIDLTWNMMCVDRRRQAVLVQEDASPA